MEVVCARKDVMRVLEKRPRVLEKAMCQQKGNSECLIT